MPPRKRKSVPKSKMSLARRANFKASKALRLLTGEKSVVFRESAGITITQAGISFSSNEMQQGDGSGTREGDQITLLSTNFRGVFTHNAGATSQQVRMMIVLDRQADGATFALGELLSFTVATQNAVASRNPQGYSRFSVLYDTMFNLDLYHGVKIIHKHIQFNHGLKIKYNGNVGDVTDLVSNNVMVVLFTPSSASQPSVRYNLKSTYLW